MDNELIVREFNELFTPQEIDLLIKFEEINAQVKYLKEERKDALINFFKKTNTDSFENEKIKIKYCKQTTRKTVDVNALKEQGIYEQFLKESPVEESVRITLKYE